MVVEALERLRCLGFVACSQLLTALVAEVAPGFQLPDRFEQGVALFGEVLGQRIVEHRYRVVEPAVHVREEQGDQQQEADEDGYERDHRGSSPFGADDVMSRRTRSR